jgi:hypothetical protein
MTQGLVVTHDTPDANIRIRQITWGGGELAHELTLDTGVPVKMSYAGLLILRGALNSYLRALDSTSRG